jgi:hypothetical protein
MKEGAVLILVCVFGTIAIVIALAWVVANHGQTP